MGQKYHKIDTVFKRDKRGRIMDGDWTRPEFEYLQDNEWLCTEKIDGTNVRFQLILTNGEVRSVGFQGRTDDAVFRENLAEHLASIQGELMGKVIPKLAGKGAKGLLGVTIYGEGFGPGIHGGGKYNPEHCDFRVFDVRVDGWWLRRPDVEDIAEVLGLDVVPLVFVGTLNDAIHMARSGFDSVWPGVVPEGLVCVPSVPLFAKGGEDRIITKIKLKDFQ